MKTKSKLVLAHSAKTSYQSVLDAESVASLLSELALNGDIVGVALAVITESGEIELACAGKFRRDLHAAHYGVSKLADVLLYPEDGGL
ncbi:hypothetical protein [Zoogloea sp.]|uniref:hypothetical protein n=1 Tax=Zoogloea sp. TaxID=49181 RepID=UPI0035AD787D